MTAKGWLAPLEQSWRAAWPDALAAWSPYTMLREPVFLESNKQAAEHGMAGEIAAIRLSDQAVMVNLESVQRQHLEGHALAILAHEVGHHVFVPGNLTDNARLFIAVKRMLEGLPEEAAHLVANLYADLLINDRLQRSAGLEMAAVYRRLRQDDGGSRVWQLYTRAYEHLWRLPAGTLCGGQVSDETEADAMLIARIVRAFGGEWLRGARRFAAIVYRYLAEDEQERRQQTFAEVGLQDTKGAGRPARGSAKDQAIPDGLTEIDASETEDNGSFDDEIADPVGEGEREDEGERARTAERRRAKTGGVPAREAAPHKEGQNRQPFEYGQILRSLGLDLSEHEITTRYYRERALPHLIPFPSRRAPQATEPVAEGYEDWQAGDPLEALDLFGSVLQSPVVVPGVTTVQRVYGESPGSDPARRPVDLDIYVDCSGSMPNPGVDISYLSLAATILALSALRMGARVQATLWSGAGQFETTGGFVRDEKRIIGTITGYLGDGTAFPLSVLRETYAQRKPDEPPVHVVVISDDGVDTMLQADDQGTPGEAVCAAALERAGAGGTLVLNLGAGRQWPLAERFSKLGFRVHPVSKWEDLIEFARAFVRENYG